MQVLILAGGLGTRLRSVVSDRPKPMADVNGKPFLEYLINNLVSKGYKKIIIAAGYKKESIMEYFGDGSNFDCSIKYSIETEPLGTGGAIANAKNLIEEDLLVLNGDTFFDINFNEFEQFHKEKDSNYTIALRKVKDVSRYGAVEFDNDDKITGFTSKGENSISNYINGGIYIIEKQIILSLELGKFISLESEIIPQVLKSKKVYGYKSKDYFIDIGIPEDYMKFIYDKKVENNDN